MMSDVGITRVNRYTYNTKLRDYREKEKHFNS